MLIQSFIYCSSHFRILIFHVIIRKISSQREVREFMATANIIYEQPLNEQIRLCLRLEYLFQKAKHYLDEDSHWGSRIALETIIEILTAVDRPDIKTKLSKTLGLYAASLNHLMAMRLPPDVDEKKLRRILEQLNKRIENLHTSSGKIGQNLRENEFISAIAQRMTTVAGTSPHNIFDYYTWLQQPLKMRIQNLEEWFTSFSGLKAAITLLLKLTRESAIFESTHVNDGFYQANLDPKAEYQMIRISLPYDTQIYPEVSVGRYRLSIHFYQLNIAGRASQINEPIDFGLACCKI